MSDDVPREEKEYRLKNLDAIQERILLQRNARLLGETVEVLVDGSKNGRWQGRTRSDKLVFFDDERDRLGDLIKVEVTRTSPWSLQGVAVDA
jgi:tRNA-2-methylthio-N6-dimethylallyladenosine synthase